VAAGTGLAERSEPGDDRRQLLQPLVRRAQLPAPPHSGSEVSVEPDGSVYPCCVKTKLPLGSLLEDDLIAILDSLAGIAAFEAISTGHPERMGIGQGWSEETFLERSTTTATSGRPYRNLCIGCDRFHEEMLGPVLEAARQRRRAAKAVGA